MTDPFLTQPFRAAVIRWRGGNKTIAKTPTAYQRAKLRGGVRHGYATP